MIVPRALDLHDDGSSGISIPLVMAFRFAVRYLRHRKRAATAGMVRSQRGDHGEVLITPTEKESDAGVIVTWRGNHRDLTGVIPEGGRINLNAGDRLEFGISNHTGSFQPKANPSIGTLEVSGDRLLLSNLTTGSTFAIENLEGGAELIKARPRRLNIVIPFEIFRILIPHRLGMVELTIFGPPPATLPESAAKSSESDDFEMNTASKYFTVLVALCEPRLRGSSMAAVPSVQEVVERLQSTNQFEGANRSSINYHIEYLADRKLPVTHWAKYVDGGRMHSKREALVAFALRFDLVREEHLALLPGFHARKRNEVTAPTPRPCSRQK